MIIIERIENNTIILEIDKDKYLNIPKNLIPNGKEGDVVKIIIDKEETKKRKEKIEELANSLFID